MFISEASSFLQNRGFQVESGLKVIFPTAEEFDNIDKDKLINIRDDNGQRKYELIGRDDLVVYYVKSKEV